MITIVLSYLSGMLPAIIMAILQKRLLAKGIASFVDDNRVDMTSRGSLRITSGRKVENGILGFEWKPSEFLKMSILSWLFIIIVGLVLLWLYINSLIDKIDGDED